MPNWNYATIVITGDKEHIDTIFKTGLDFQVIRPMPKEIYDDSIGKNFGGRDWKIDDEIPTLDDYVKNARNKKEREFYEKSFYEVIEGQKLVKSWIEKYGVNGWYEWASKYWGTKWNPFPHDVELERVSDIKMEVTMKTAWGLPIEILKHITRNYPVQIHGTTEEESEGRTIPFVIDDGKLGEVFGKI